MNYILSISKQAIQAIDANNVITAKTNFNNTYSYKAYQLLKEKSNLQNFFFSFEWNGANLDDITHNLPENDYIIVVSLPETENIFKMLYYDFTDLIYYFDNASDTELSEGGYKAIEVITNSCMSGKVTSNNELIQANFETIQKDWILERWEYKDWGTGQ
jgi:hypothetical protein